MSNLALEKFHTALLTWYRSQKRALPWRKNKDPYRVWISEIMLQQTRVEAVIPYYERFLSHFPTVVDLANASEDKVTNLWAGLGYYSRARNLRKAAIEVRDRFKGKMPSTKEELISLPGIGDYTSSAIASIAFNKQHIALDGNLERVLARVLGEAKDPKREGRAMLLALGEKLVLHGKAGNVNQALMDLSSALCAPKNPKCMQCPLAKFCVAHKAGTTATIPFRKKKAEAIELKSRGWILIASSEEKHSVLLARRKKGTWLAGMWDLPWWLEEEGERKAPKKWQRRGEFTTRRGITKYDIEFSLDIYQVRKPLEEKEITKHLHSAGEEFRWCSLEELERYNLPRPSEKALEAALRTL